jgi:hypothetical protein
MADEELLPEENEHPNAATEDGVKRQRQTARRRSQEQNEVIKNLLSSAAGRRFYHDIVFKLCGVHDPLTAPTLNDGYTLFREGARQVGLDLQNRALQAAREQYMVLLSENMPNI